MKTCLSALLCLLLVLAATPSWSQANDAAAERARIANQRIQAEAERQAAEEAARAEQAEAERQAEERAVLAERAEAERQVAEKAALAQRAETERQAEERAVLTERAKARQVAAEEAVRARQPAPAAAARPAPDRPPVPPAALATEGGSTAALPETSRADMSRMMQQLRTLGELRDAGYVTAEEFERIKQRLLDGEL